MLTKTFPRRAAGISISLFLILLTLPVQIIIFFILWMELKEFPVIKQERALTLSGQRISMLKFKTMKCGNGSGDPGRKVESVFYKDNAAVKIPPFAKYMRLSALDELPQLFNVLEGSMELIGPRPLVISELRYIEKNFPIQYEIRKRIRSKPGITGLWQAYCRRSGGIYYLVEADKIYELHKSFVLDVRIILRTLMLMLAARTSDAYLTARNNEVPDKSYEYLYKENGFIFKTGLSKTVYTCIAGKGYWTSSIANSLHQRKLS